MNQPEEEIQKGTVVWLFGRGASVACNLRWTVPEEWKCRPRCEQIAMITHALSSEMQIPEVDRSIYKEMLGLLSKKTENNWQHLFVTTNWDCLLQQEIQNRHLSFPQPWLLDSHVFHLNGTIETGEYTHNRSPFLLETDPPATRTSAVEPNVAFNKMIWRDLFVAVGISFDCEMDRSLLRAFNSVQDDLPIGESRWIIINPNDQSLEPVSNRICSALPQATVQKVAMSLEDWIAEGMPQLQCLGVLST